MVWVRMPVNIGASRPVLEQSASDRRNPCWMPWAGCDDEVIAYVTTQAAADTALAGSDTGVRDFLHSRDYPGRETNDVKVNQIMSAARANGSREVAAMRPN